MNPLILASGSPRRAELLKAAGYEFTVRVASDEAECGICSRETAPELVARYAYRKADDVVGKLLAEGQTTGMVLAADTVASLRGQILGKPHDADHAREMITSLSGNRHDVYTGVCLWSLDQSHVLVDVSRTELLMNTLTPQQVDEHIESLRWEGKAGAFGFQDGNEWVKIIGDGSGSNVVGLPMERLAELLENFDSMAESVERDG